MEHLIEILKDCSNGVRSAQEKLYSLFSEKMFGVCMYYTKDYSEAEDLFQEGFLKVLTNISQFRSEGSFEGWMRRIFVNCAMERFRKKKYLFPVENIQHYQQEYSSETITSNISANNIMELVSELSPQYRMVFNLYAIEGYSHKEIGKFLNISEGTSKSNLARARIVLQDKIKNNFKILPIYNESANGK